MADSQWIGQSLSMTGWSVDIMGDTQESVFFGIPALVSGFAKLTRVMVQYSFWTQLINDDENDGRFPFPVGVGVNWHPEPGGSVEASNFVPANGDTLCSAVCDFKPYRTAFLGVQGTIWASAGVVEPINSNTSRDIVGADGEGYSIHIDWTHNADWSTSLYSPTIPVTGYALVRTLWKRG